MTSPTFDNLSNITDELLMEMLFRADKLLNSAATSRLSIGDVLVSSSTHSLDVFIEQHAAYTYWKPEDSAEVISLHTVRRRSNWAALAFRGALEVMREAMVLDDLAEIH